MLKGKHSYLFEKLVELINCFNHLQIKDHESYDQGCLNYGIIVQSTRFGEPEIGFMDFGFLPDGYNYCVGGSRRLHINAHQISEFMALSFWIILLKEYVDNCIKDPGEAEEIKQCIYMFELDIIREPKQLR